MIQRIWHGWTTPERADAYETLLGREVFPAIEAKRIAGLDGIRLLRRATGAEVEFVTLLTFDSIDAVRALTGEDHEAAYVPAAARAVLARFDERVRHYELRIDLGREARPLSSGDRRLMPR